MSIYTIFVSNVENQKFKELKNILKLSNCEVVYSHWRHAVYKLATHSMKKVMIIVDKMYSMYEIIFEKICFGFKNFKHIKFIFLDDCIKELSVSKKYKNMFYVPYENSELYIKEIADKYNEEEYRFMIKRAYFRNLLISLGFDSDVSGFDYLLEIESLLNYNYKLDEKVLLPSLYAIIRKKENINESNIERNLRTLIKKSKLKGLSAEKLNLPPDTKLTNCVIVKVIYNLFFSFSNSI